MTTSTNEVPLSYGVWTDIGIAPLVAVLASGSYDVHLRESDSEPSPAAPAHYFLNACSPSAAIRTGSHIWGKVSGNDETATATLDVTTGISIPGSSGGSGGSGSNASVGSTGAAVPSAATAFGFQNASGKLSVPTPAAGLPIADSGVAAAGVSQPTGGSGLSGWLSGIYKALSGVLAVSWTGQSVGVTSIPDGVAGYGSTVAGANQAFSGLNALSTAGFGKLVVACTSAGAATIAFRGSNDGGTTWTPVLASRVDLTTTAALASISNPTVGAVWEAPCTHALLQVYCTAFTTSPTLSWCLKGPGAFLHSVVDQGAANASSPWLIQARTSISGGVSTATVIIGAATTNAGSIKASAGQVYAIDLSNNAATWAYFRLYNKASAPTVGTDAVVAEYGVAPNSSRTISFSDLGAPFSTGIAYSITAAAALNDATALAAAGTVVATVHSN